jgi:serine/threonine-protein kinase HipA
MLTPRGWRWSPAYDMNPNEMENGLTLNITESSNERGISLAMATASLYHLKTENTQGILADIRKNNNGEHLPRSTELGKVKLSKRSERFDG